MLRENLSLWAYSLVHILCMSVLLMPCHALLLHLQCFQSNSRLVRLPLRRTGGTSINVGFLWHNQNKCV
jgi:hypothetical protein